MRNAQLGTVYVHSWIQSDLDALSVCVLYIHNVMLAVFICTVLCACVHTFVCMCIHVCHNDMEVCPVVLSATCICCVSLPIYHKGRVPVDTV